MQDTKTGTRDWHSFWEADNIPWDHGESSPALVKLVNEHSELIPSRGIGLVPGCGSGYDVELLSSPERHMTGLDLVPKCIEVCKKKYADKQGNFDFICADFYTFEYPKGGYDLVYDYTFLCAMPPEMRPQWSARMAEIVKPGGTLIALMFPIEEREGGPPYPVTPELYDELLGENFDRVFIEDAKGHKSRLGREKMSVWKRKLQ